MNKYIYFPIEFFSSTLFVMIVMIKISGKWGERRSTVVGTTATRLFGIRKQLWAIKFILYLTLDKLAATLISDSPAWLIRITQFNFPHFTYSHVLNFTSKWPEIINQWYRFLIYCLNAEMERSVKGTLCFDQNSRNVSTLTRRTICVSKNNENSNRSTWALEKLPSSPFGASENLW